MENITEEAFLQAVEETKNRMDIDVAKVKANLSAFIKINEMSPSIVDRLLNRLNKYNVLEEIVIDGLVAIVHLPEYPILLEFHTTNNKYTILYKRGIRIEKNGHVLK